MKTTLELPDDLMRSVKVRAAATDRKIKDVVEEMIRNGLAAGTDAEPASTGKSGKIKLADCVGAFPHFRSMQEVTDYVSELRRDRDENA